MALLVLFRSIICLLVTAPLRVTTQVSAPAPLKELLLHDNPVSCTAPKEATGKQAAKKPSKPTRNSSICWNPFLRPASSGLWEEISSAAHLRPKGGGRRRTCIDGTSRSAFAHVTCTRAHSLCEHAGPNQIEGGGTKYLLTRSSTVLQVSHCEIDHNSFTNWLP
jgi:hypothetical protein